MGLVGDLLGKAVSGVKNLISNARIGKQAVASGFTTGIVSQGQQQALAQQAGTVLGLPIQWVVGGLLFLLFLSVLFFSMFSKRKR